MSKYDEIPPLNDKDARKAIIGILVNMAVGIMFWVTVLSILALSRVYL